MLADQRKKARLAAALMAQRPSYKRPCKDGCLRPSARTSGISLRSSIRSFLMKLLREKRKRNNKNLRWMLDRKSSSSKPASERCRRSGLFGAGAATEFFASGWSASARSLSERTDKLEKRTIRSRARSCSLRFVAARRSSSRPQCGAGSTDARRSSAFLQGRAGGRWTIRAAARLATSPPPTRRASSETRPARIGRPPKVFLSSRGGSNH